MNDTVAQRRIVVGVDGSASSRAALRWAVRQAALVGAAVEAVITWEYPAVYHWGVPVADVDDGVVAGYAGKTLAEAVAEETGPQYPVEVRERVEYGNAAQVLLEVAEGAELLVLGNRGHGGFVGALLGSVSQHCVHHASCPVVVVRDTEHEQTEPAERTEPAEGSAAAR
ncbi:universal stress protein [Kitasatospora sp. NPDC096204]|uniref:universal stress protein n=1 Tax=Kitasatospora sp. NPDC096204 TaxID=3364094 RepID=UPI003800A7BE